MTSPAVRSELMLEITDFTPQDESAAIEDCLDRIINLTAQCAGVPGQVIYEEHGVRWDRPSTKLCQKSLADSITQVDARRSLQKVP
jgi:hypothetical protein